VSRLRPPARVPAGALVVPLADLALYGLAGLLGVGCLLWAGAVVACLGTGRGVPNGGPLHALATLGHPADPASAWPDESRLPGPVAYWAGTAATLLALGCAAETGFRFWRHRRAGTHPSPVRSLPGLATVREVSQAAGRRAVLRRGRIVRPALHDRAHRLEPGEVGYLLGRVRGRPLWCSVEDSVLLVGPPRMGKGLHLVIPWILDAAGPVVATSTRPDTLAVTYHARTDRGPVAIFDPQRLAGLPGGLRWSPVRGCQLPSIALVRARGLAAGVGFGRTVSDSDFWAGQTETTLRCLLHAPALDGRGPVDLYRWSLNPALAENAVTVLTRHPDAASGWADALDAAVHADPRTRDSIWLGVRQALAALGDPDVLHAVTPEQGKQFHPEAFLRDRGTLFLLAAAVTSASCAPLVAAFVEDITETARAVAAQAAGARLDPPLLLALDEIANLTPLPSLPSLMAEGGGTGITTLAVLQSLAQARHRWGEHAADTIWDAATVKIVLGGLAKLRDLEDVARLLGEIDEPVRSMSQGRFGDHSSSISVRQVPVMPPSVLRTLPFGTGVLLLRHTRPVVIDLRPWPSRPDANRLHAGRTLVETAVAGHVAPGPLSDGACSR
jgi:type IV secretion system protein VirD4